MRQIQFNPCEESLLNLGHQFDNKAREIFFPSFRQRNDTKLFFNFEKNSIEKYSIELKDDRFEVTTPLTLNCGIFKSQLVEMSEDGEVVHGNMFRSIVHESIDANHSYDPTDQETIKLATEMKALYDELSERFERGDFNKPVKGVDYYTDEEKVEFAEQLSEEADKIFVKHEELDKPVFVQDDDGSISIDGDAVTQYEEYDDSEVKREIARLEKDKADKTEIPTVPSNVSAFNNDAGYLTEHQPLTDYAKKSEIPSLEGYAKKKDIPTVPTKVSELVNDEGYLKEHQSLEGLATEEDLESAKSELSESIINKLDKPSDTPEVGKVLKIKSVNDDGSFVCEWADGTDLTDYVKNTDYASESSAGVLMAKDAQGFGVSNGNLYVRNMSLSDYGKKGNTAAISKGTLENILPSKVKDNAFFVAQFNVTPFEDVKNAIDEGKQCIIFLNNRVYTPTYNAPTQITFNAIDNSQMFYIYVLSSGKWGNGVDPLQATTYKKNSIIGNEESTAFYPTTKAVFDYAEPKKGEWVLKGTLTTENKDTGVNVDLTGCTELTIYGSCDCTGNSAINCRDEGGSFSLTGSVFTSSSKYIIVSSETTVYGIGGIKSAYGTSSTRTTTGVQAYNILNRSIGAITSINLSAPANITSCNIEIYAR